MAQQGIQLNEEKLCCSICLDLLKDPVTIPCGHNYCKNCIKSFWEEKCQKKRHSCPQCRQTFRSRPVLVKNTMLAELVEEVKKTGLQAAPADHCYAGPDDVACDFCTGRKRKAAKSCLQCQLSSCEQHLQPHYEVAPLKKHKLVNPSANIQENVCSRHSEVMKIFCRTDQQCICYLCSINEHKGHDTVSAAAETTERQKELGASWQKIQQRIQDREKDVVALQQEVEAINRSADKAVRDSDEIFNELVHVIRKRSSGVKHLIKSRQKNELSRVKELQKKLQQEITELRRKDAELEKLSQTEDHTQLFHNFPSLSNLTESTSSPSINIRPPRCFEDVTAAVSEVGDKLQDILKEDWMKICMNDRSLTDTDADVLLPPAEPKTRAEFLQYSKQITLDPNTAHTEVALSEGNRKATNMEVSQLYSPQPDRFTDMFQVLSRESLTRRCYWEVEWSGGGVSVAVTYKDISRTGDDSGFGNNDKSWSLECPFFGDYQSKQKKISAAVSGPRSSRVGVYLDHRAGVLSFYSVSETMTLLHRVQTTFAQPLYAGLGVNYFGSTAELCELY
ncbi:tripartite motif-containing protein 16-like [Seriola aureovittata]|uniref:tripartite motif-containing protein 16-like n=1 Tax=Seriola aureovittata TaxID=2871759 RepID=UPI0024BEE561|nr:tripartite motif-containing protein 16-like [Seriola aureovittata]